jgi:nucleoside-diphosphate-sugar epimerase
LSSPGRTIVITGAAGFVGSRLSQALLSHPDVADADFRLIDVREGELEDPRAVWCPGDISDPTFLNRALTGANTIFHLAAVLGGAAENDPALARRINVEAPIRMLETLREAGTCPRFVFASSIAVFGPPLPTAQVDDSTWPLPTMVYGAQKLMIEAAIEQYSARGWIDGISLRLPGIVARADADARLKSAFLNRLFYAVADGDDISLPVSSDGTSWLISVPTCVDAFVHAGLLPSERLGRRRTLTLPAQRIRMADLVDSLHRRFPNGRANVTYDIDPEVDAQFAAYPPLVTQLGDELGFVHDGSIDRLVERAIEGRSSAAHG